jgi:hypothetical protein
MVRHGVRGEAGPLVLGGPLGVWGDDLGDEVGHPAQFGLEALHLASLR